MGSQEITIFEQSTQWGDGPKKDCHLGEELQCQAVLDMDARTLTLTINGKTIKQDFSEAMTTVDYIGFAIKDAETLFTKPVIQ